MQHPIAHEASALQWRKRLLIICFAPVVLAVLAADSRWLYERGIDAQILSNIAGPFYIWWLISALKPEQRLMTLIFVPFSAIGEGIFSLLFGLYTYKFGMVPIYVPFGHAIMFGTGLLIAESAPVVRHEARVRWALLLFHGGLILGALLWLGDTLSGIFGLLAIFVLYRKRFNVFYLIMGVLVLYIEWIGTWFGCWFWHLHPFGLLSTTNPPVGAFVCYLIADLIVMRLARMVGWWLHKL